MKFQALCPGSSSESTADAAHFRTAAQPPCQPLNPNFATMLRTMQHVLVICWTRLDMSHMRIRIPWPAVATLPSPKEGARQNLAGGQPRVAGELPRLQLQCLQSSCSTGVSDPS